MTDDPLARVLAEALHVLDGEPDRADFGWYRAEADAILAAIPPDTADAMRAGLLLADVAAIRHATGHTVPVLYLEREHSGTWHAQVGATLSAPGPTLAAALSDLLARLGDDDERDVAPRMARPLRRVCVACGLVTEDPDAYAVTEADGDAEERPGHACPSTADGRHEWARARGEGPMSEMTLLPVGTRVRSVEHPSLTGRIHQYERTPTGMLSAVPYLIRWDDPEGARRLLGWFFVYATEGSVEPEGDR